jgi:hypothetical protein
MGLPPTQGNEKLVRTHGNAALRPSPPSRPVGPQRLLQRKGGASIERSCFVEAIFHCLGWAEGPAAYSLEKHLIPPLRFAPVRITTGNGLCVDVYRALNLPQASQMLDRTSHLKW